MLAPKQIFAVSTVAISLRGRPFILASNSDSRQPTGRFPSLRGVGNLPVSVAERPTAFLHPAKVKSAALANFF